MNTNEAETPPIDEKSQMLMDLNQVHVGEDSIRHALQLPADFALWSENRNHFYGENKDWTLGPAVVHRDSDDLEKSNAIALEKELERVSLLGVFPREDWDILEFSHWAVGWVRHVCFRAVSTDEEGELQPTTVFKYIQKWFEDLKEYPIADEIDYRNRQLDTFAEGLQWEYSNAVTDDAPDDWSTQLAKHLLNESDEEMSGDRLIINEKPVHIALKDLGWLEEDIPL